MAEKYEFDPDEMDYGEFEDMIRTEAHEAQDAMLKATEEGRNNDRIDRISVGSLRSLDLYVVLLESIP